VEGQELVTTAAYGLARHPMYMAVLGLTLAIGLACSHWIGFAAGLALVRIGTIICIGIEERLLHQAFGAQLDAYTRSVPALMPRPRG